MPRRSVAASIIVMAALALAVSASRPAPTQAGGGCHAPDGSAHTEGPATVVRMDVCSFEPTVARVPVGTTVRFLNTAPNDHAVAGRSRSWGSDMLRPGAEFSQRFDAAGVYPYACPLHPGMVGAVVVGEGAAAAAPVSQSDPAPAAATTTPVSADPAPIAAGAVAGLAGGAIIGLLGAGLVFGRRRSTTRSTASDRARPSAIDG